MFFQRTDQNTKNAKVAGSNYRNLTGTKEEREIIETIVTNKERATDARRNAYNPGFKQSSKQTQKQLNQANKLQAISYNAKQELKEYRKNNL